MVLAQRLLTHQSAQAVKTQYILSSPHSNVVLLSSFLFRHGLKKISIGIIFQTSLTLALPSTLEYLFSLQSQNTLILKGKTGTGMRGEGEGCEGESTAGEPTARAPASAIAAGMINSCTETETWGKEKKPRI